MFVIKNVREYALGCPYYNIHSLILQVSYISIMVYTAAATIPVFFLSVHPSYETYSYELYSIVADNSHTT